MKSIIVFFSFVLIFSLPLSGQKKISHDVQLAQESVVPYRCQPFKLSQKRHDGLRTEELKEFMLLELDTKLISDLSTSKIPYLQLSLPQPKGDEIMLDLIETDVFTDDFSIVQAPEMKKISYKGGKHFQGIIRGMDDSFVAISVFADEIAGIISFSSGSGNWVLGKLQDNPLYILYEDHQIDKLHPGVCHTEDDLSLIYSSEQLRFRKVSQRSDQKCLNVYLEVDYDIYQSRQESVTKTVDYISSLMNQVLLLYRNEQIGMRVSEITVWTEQSPYDASTSSEMLGLFRNMRSDFNGDIAQLLSFKTSGGIAYVNTLCTPNKSFRTSFSRIQDNFQDVPVYSWSVHVIAHELGHIIGSQHTHACVWNGNNTAIDGCATPEGSCFNPGIPDQGGTVMSYCHTSPQGIQFSQGFGPQPGNVLRYNVAHAECLQSCTSDGQNDSDCQDISFTLELKTDSYPSETTWDIINSENKTVLSGGPYSSRHTVFSSQYCLPAGCYTLHIKDQYGDGICCDYGEGYYKIILNEQSTIEGIRFSEEAFTSFCLIDKVPSCDDGIQNGDEEGVDCGGTCAPCVTCTDGVQNGNETGVDCGGDCPSCPDENDYTVADTLAGHYFENGWDSWSRGGVHASRVRSIHAPEGSFCLRLRNGQDSLSSVYSPDYEITDNQLAALVFKYKAVGMEEGKSFNMHVHSSDGWTIQKSYRSGEDFVNNVTYSDTIKNIQTSVSNLRVKFENLGIDNSDLIYLDAIEILVYNNPDEEESTCSDGIQNGNETGIDCGGDCLPCEDDEDETTDNDDQTGSGQQVVPTELAGYYFEESIEGWIRGGTNSSRVFSVHSPEGQYSLRLRNGQGMSSSISSPWMYLSDIDSLRIDFSLKTVSFESGKTLLISYYDGWQWQDLVSLISGQDFNTNQTQHFSFMIPHSFSSDFQIRWTSGGTDNSDLVYMDAVKFVGYHPENVTPVVITNTNPLAERKTEETPLLSPNPADSYVYITMNDLPSLVRIISLSGEVLQEESMTRTLDVSALHPGVYIAVIFTEDQTYRLKFVKR